MLNIMLQFFLVTLRCYKHPESDITYNIIILFIKLNPAFLPQIGTPKCKRSQNFVQQFSFNYKVEQQQNCFPSELILISSSLLLGLQKFATTQSCAYLLTVFSGMYFQIRVYRIVAYDNQHTTVCDLGVLVALYWYSRHSQNLEVLITSNSQKHLDIFACVQISCLCSHKPATAAQFSCFSTRFGESH